MKILVYGAGPLGSLFAALLHQAGHQVSLLARGQRLLDLREKGIVLVDWQTGRETITQVEIIEQLEPEDAYDLVLVIMRKNRALELLPVLARNKHTPNILFLMNNAAGPGQLVEALGASRVMMGFPMAAGYRRGPAVHYLVGSRKGHKVSIPIGEASGKITPRLRETGNILASMPGFDADLRCDMDAWLKTHVALLMPSLAPAFTAAGRDIIRMAHTRDLVVLTIRAIREGFRVLRKLNIPITPGNLRVFDWMPEPILVCGLQKILINPRMQVALVMHAESAHDEVMHLAEEFEVLARPAAIPTPAIDCLRVYFDPATPPMPEGSAKISLDWSGVWAAGGVLAAVIGSMGIWHLTKAGRPRQR